MHVLDITFKNFADKKVNFTPLLLSQFQAESSLEFYRTTDNIRANKNKLLMDVQYFYRKIVRH